MTKSTFFVEEDKILATLFDEGMDNLHLWKPGSSPLYSERLLTLLPEDDYSKITVHDHFYLKEEYGLAGIHLDTPDMDVPKGYKGSIGRSCDDLSNLKDIKKKSNYIFLNHPFDSIENKESKSNFTMEQLEEYSDDGVIDKKVFAIGGMSLENIKTAKSLKFGGVVICGDLWNKFDIHKETDFKELMSHFEKLRKAVS
jgi:thiamine-phosphate pyrophosphorylase